MAVVTRPGDRAGELPETRVVPVGMAQDTDFGAYFPLGTARMFFHSAGAPASAQHKKPAAPLFSLDSHVSGRDGESSFDFFRAFFSRRKETAERPGGASRPPETAEDILLDLASRMDSDGGMRGKNREDRAIASVVALLAFLSQGHTETGGAFRSHVTRLVAFLKSLTGLSSDRQRIVAAVIELAREGPAPAGEWITLARTSGDHWKEVERSMQNAKAAGN